MDRQKKRSEHEVDQAKKVRKMWSFQVELFILCEGWRQFKYLNIQVISNLESSLEKAESDKQGKENQIRLLS